MRDRRERFQVSMETIRRDLNELEETKMIRRVHGGAILNTQCGVVPDYTRREVENIDEKNLTVSQLICLVWWMIQTFAIWEDFQEVV